MTNQNQTAVATPDQAPEHVYHLSPEARRAAWALLLGVLAIVAFALWSLAASLSKGLQGPEWVSAALMLAILALSPFVAWSLLAEIKATIRSDAAGLTYQTLGGVRLSYPWTEVRGLALAPAWWRPLFFGDKARAVGRIAAGGRDGPGPASATATTTDGTTEITISQHEGMPVTGQDVEILSAETQASPEEPADEDVLHLVVDPPALERIANPLVRLLHQQAYAGAIPIYAGLAGRPALLVEIAKRAGMPGG